MTLNFSELNITTSSDSRPQRKQSTRRAAANRVFNPALLPGTITCSRPSKARFGVWSPTWSGDGLLPRSSWAGGSRTRKHRHGRQVPSHPTVNAGGSAVYRQRRTRFLRGRSGFDASSVGSQRPGFLGGGSKRRPWPKGGGLDGELGTTHGPRNPWSSRTQSSPPR